MYLFGFQHEENVEHQHQLVRSILLIGSTCIMSYMRKGKDKTFGRLSMKMK
ncbi:hypothetical protein V6Z12_D02G070800 [Gossypium hirsutum]